MRKGAPRAHRCAELPKTLHLQATFSAPRIRQARQVNTQALPRLHEKHCHRHQSPRIHAARTATLNTLGRAYLMPAGTNKRPVFFSHFLFIWLEVQKEINMLEYLQ